MSENSERKWYLKPLDFLWNSAGDIKDKIAGAKDAALEKASAALGIDKLKDAGEWLKKQGESLGKYGMPAAMIVGGFGLALSTPLMGLDAVPIIGGFLRGLVGLIGCAVAFFGIFSAAKAGNAFGLFNKDKAEGKEIEVAITSPDLTPAKTPELQTPQMTAARVQDVADTKSGGLDAPLKKEPEELKLAQRKAHEELNPALLAKS